MFEKLLLKTVKKDDVIIVNPSKSKVKVINVFDSDKSKVNWLRSYWNDIYDIDLPISFKIVVCQFATSPYKNYNYPLLKICVKKPIRQYQPKLAWKLLRQEYNNRGKRQFIADLLGVNREDLSKAKGEMNDNKGNWHPSSDYTQYQQGS